MSERMSETAFQRTLGVAEDMQKQPHLKAAGGWPKTGALLADALLESQRRLEEAQCFLDAEVTNHRIAVNIANGLDTQLRQARAEIERLKQAAKGVKVTYLPDDDPDLLKAVEGMEQPNEH